MLTNLHPNDPRNERDQPPPHGAPPKKPVLKIRWGDDAATPRPMGTIVKGLMHSSSLTLFYGPPKTGKSFLVTDLFNKIADDECDYWMGHKIMRHDLVLYVACEGHGGFWKRLDAIKKDRGKPLPKNFGLWSGRPVLLRIDEKTHAMVPHADDVLAAVRQIISEKGRKPIAVAIDTVFRSFGPGNVSSSTDMTAYLAALAEIMDQGIALVAVHHEVKAGGTPAGSVALTGGSDNLARTQQLEGGGYAWHVEMAKDDAETEPRRFDLEPVDVSPDPEAGEPQTSCVVRDSGETVKPKAKEAKVSIGELKQRWFKECYFELADEVTPAPGYTAALVRKVAIEDIRELMVARGFLAFEDGAIPVTERTAFKRARQALMATGTFTADKTHFWQVELQPSL